MSNSDQIGNLPVAPVPVIGASALGWYSLADYLTPDDESAKAVEANSTAMQSLWNTVIAAGGGTIWVPSRTWYHAINGASAVVKLTGAVSAPINARVTIRGEGPGSVLAWGGNASGGSKDFFQFNNGIWNITFRDLKLIQNRAITNPDGDQHHLIDSLSSKWSNNENLNVINCTFGVVKGDCVRMVGGQAITGMHANYAGNKATNLFPGPYTQPLFPQRVCAQYEANYDGGAITIVGTDGKNTALTEVIPAPIGTTDQTMIGQFEFKTITSATKATVGANAANASVGYDYRIRTINIVNCVFNGFDYLNADPGYLYRAPISVQRSTTGLFVSGCRVSGSDDQLIDMEPTSNGDVTDCVIEGNFFDAHDVNVVTITLSGNGSRDAIKRTVFTNNVIRNGRIACFDIDGVIVSNNRIYTPKTGAAPAIFVSKLCTNAQFLDNIIVSASNSAATHGIAILRNTALNDAPNNVIVRGNIITGPLANGGGIFIEDCSKNITIEGNVIRNLSATAAAGTGIFVKMTANTGDVHNIHISGNSCEDAGGGTLHTCFHFAGDTTTPTNLVISDNTGYGAVRGVLIDAISGAWGNYPVVTGNACGGCTTPVSIDSTVIICTGGQQGGVAQFSGAGSPETIVIAPIGSKFTRTNGSAGIVDYTKNSGSAATGWVPMGGVVATGTVTCVAKASMVDAESVTIGDGVTAAKVYEFDVAGDGVTAGRIQVNISTDTTATQVGARLAIAIAANQPLLTASNAAGVVTLTHKIAGAFANIAIKEAVANAGFLVTGMAGGINPGR